MNIWLFLWYINLAILLLEYLYWNMAIFLEYGYLSKKELVIYWNMLGSDRRFGTFELFSHSVGNFIIPTDEFIFFRGVETTNQ